MSKNRGQIAGPALGDYRCDISGIVLGVTGVSVLSGTEALALTD